LGTNNPVIALAAISRIERQLELEAKLLGQLDESTKIAVGVNVAPQEAADYSKVPLEQLTQALDLMKRARAILNGEAPFAADVVVNLPPEVKNECPTPTVVAVAPCKAGIEPAPLSSVPIESDGKAKSPAPEKNWKNWPRDDSEHLGEAL
jgi:hypothetical protein